MTTHGRSGPQVPESIDIRYPVEPDRIIAAVFIAVGLGVGLLSADLLGVTLPQILRGLLVVPLWVLVGLYLLADLLWGFAVFDGLRRDSTPIDYGADDVQVRILTIDAEATVQKTVDALPETLADRHVIAETDLDITGAEVHVVPEDFECTAADKGRALEWARRHVQCDKEFVLFLDEDTLIPEFEGLPDADIVQFREHPGKTGSWLSFWSEVLRMGWQVEQLGFAEFDIPLYTWGGGLAVRKTVEDEITWNFYTLIEDTVFTWFAVENGASYEVAETRFRNQAPRSIKAMFEQRRRWVTGTIQGEKFLPAKYHMLLTVRNVVWALSPVLVAQAAVTLVLPVRVFDYLPFQASFLLLAVMTLVWTGAGVWYYGGPDLRTLPVIPLLPVLIVLHSLGAVWGFVSRPAGFKQTSKTSATSVSD